MFGKAFKQMGKGMVTTTLPGNAIPGITANSITVARGDPSGNDPWGYLLKATESDAMGCTMTYSKLSKLAGADPNYLENHVDEFVKVIITWSRKFKFAQGKTDRMGNTLSTLMSLYQGKFSQEAWNKLIPAYLELLCNKAFPHPMMVSMKFAQLRETPQILFPLAEQILTTMFQNDLKMLAIIVIQVYPKQRKLVQQNVDKIFKWIDEGEYAIEVINIIAQESPDVLLPYGDKIVAMLSSGKAGTNMQAVDILVNIIERNPYKFVNSTQAIRDGMDSFLPQCAMLKGTLARALGLIGRTSYEKAVECTEIIVDLMQYDRNSDNLVSYLKEMKNIGGVFKSVLESKRDVVKSQLASQFEGVRTQAASLLDYLDNKAINSLPTALAIQDAKIEQQAVALGVVAKNQAAADKEVGRLGEENRAQQQQINDLDRRVAQLQNANEYIDAKIAEIKVFIADVVKKLPVPTKFSVDGIIVKTITLEFHCSLQRDAHCLHSGSNAFVTRTHEWSKWVKLAISAAKMGLAVYNKDAIGAVEVAFDVYEQLKDFEDPSFDNFVQQPVLTSAEQDSMINQLRDAKFFDVFMYNPQDAKWECCNCVKAKKAVASPQQAAHSHPEDSSSASANAGVHKRHTFVLHHFSRFTWCVHCDQFIWGLGKQGYKCKECKYRCHPQCIQKVPDNCGQVAIKCHISGKNAKF